MSERHRSYIVSRWLPEDYRQRPREYDPTIADEIVEQVANGGLLPDVCALSLSYPLPATFLRWAEDNPDLAAAYERAVRLRSDIMLDEAASAAFTPDPSSAGVRSRTLLDHVRLSNSGKYGSQAGRATRTDDTERPDYGAEVRRRIEAMAKKHRDAEAASARAARLATGEKSR